MNKTLEETLRVLLAKEDLEPKEGDLERFGPLLEQYIVTLKTLRAVDVSDEEIAGAFHPEWK
jgi:hypothetical protein